MDYRRVRLVAAVIFVPFVFSSCANLSPGGNAAAFGAGAAFIANGIAGAAGVPAWQKNLITVGTGLAVAGLVYVVAKRRASERQRQIAERRARVYVGRLASSGSHRRSTVSKPRPRYIAVDTVNDSRTSAKAKKSVMIYDTRSEEFVGNSVYDVQSTPRVGTTAKYETVSAEYVGTGD